MPLYFFRIRCGRYSGAGGHGTELADDDAAWNELTRICGEMAGGISRNLAQNAEWQMEILDESQKPVFRIRLVGETLDSRPLASTARRLDARVKSLLKQTN